MPAPLVGVVLFTNILRYFLPKFWARREPPTERGDERLVALAGRRARRGLGGLGQRWVRRQPEANEYGQRFDGDDEVALHPRHSSVELIEPFRRRLLLPFGGVGRQKRRNAGFCDQRQGLIAPGGVGGERFHDIGFEIHG